ncbi:hypothetical protein F5B21DRAFT_504829 [Xylaria acuta]|nr:hypothetical protein F5B21DRAFT_504829 [Xylaria acuta]
MLPLNNFNPFTNNVLPLDPNPQSYSSLLLDHTHLCPQSHNHSRWPRKGLLEIQKCKKCQFCDLELKTAAGLRKHVNGYKNDGFHIEVVPGTCGKQRRALLPNKGPGVLGQPGAAAKALTRAQDDQAGARIQEPFAHVETSEVSLRGPDEITMLRESHGREVAHLRSRIEALEVELRDMRKKDKYKCRDRDWDWEKTMKESQKEWLPSRGTGSELTKSYEFSITTSSQAALPSGGCRVISGSMAAHSEESASFGGTTHSLSAPGSYAPTARKLTLRRDNIFSVERSPMDLLDRRTWGNRCS